MGRPGRILFSQIIRNLDLVVLQKGRPELFYVGKLLLVEEQHVSVVLPKNSASFHLRVKWAEHRCCMLNELSNIDSICVFRELPEIKERHVRNFLTRNLVNRVLFSRKRYDHTLTHVTLLRLRRGPANGSLR